MHAAVKPTFDEGRRIEDLSGLTISHADSFGWVLSAT